MYIYKAKSFVGSKGLHAFDKLKDKCISKSKELDLIIEFVLC